MYISICIIKSYKFFLNDIRKLHNYITYLCISYVTLYRIVIMYERILVLERFRYAIYIIAKVLPHIQLSIFTLSFYSSFILFYLI